MKTAIASKTKDKNSEISENAGRSPYYIIFDESGKVIEVVKNPFSVGGGGAGYGVAKMLADKGVNTIIAGEFGPNMIEAMEQRKIKYEKKEGKVGDAL